MPTIEVTDEQIVEAVRKMGAERRRSVLLMLASGDEATWHRLRARASAGARRFAAERGLIWDEMDEDARLAFIDDVVHEDRVESNSRL